MTHEWKEIRNSLRRHPEQWEIKSLVPGRWDDHKLQYLVFHKKSGVIIWIGRQETGYNPSNVLKFHKDSKVKLDLGWYSKWRLWIAVKVAIKRKLRRQMNPEVAQFNNYGEIFCPYCGEKFLTDAFVLTTEGDES